MFDKMDKTIKKPAFFQKKPRSKMEIYKSEY